MQIPTIEEALLIDASHKTGRLQLEHSYMDSCIQLIICYNKALYNW